VNADAISKPGADDLLDFGTTSDAEKGSERQQRFRAFYVSAHAVTGRLACLSVVPAAVIFNVTPRPE
jgi:hypothetical protein